MTKTATKMKKSVSILMVVLTLMSVFAVFAVPASASTTSSGTQTRTITVTTKGNWFIPGSESITLKQTKGTCEKTTTNWFTGKKSTKVSQEYGTWNIVAQATDGSHSVRKTLSGGSVKIPLKPDKTYKITVTWNSMIGMGIEVAKGDFVRLPSWKVSSTYKVSSYY